ncbi:DNA-methyltransferase [Burkholderia multivorans]|uniref:DNA-methyltransferase n=1 Tax=Burkholderia multivorans TaxID=87883 RepID=UPI0018DB8A2D|nr:site-specific DNA-methyltransferase [Burkholderia multivorans]MBH9662032.1 site-specific DNA-methyltransferase [Burkholderia multivorans]
MQRIEDAMSDTITIGDAALHLGDCRDVLKTIADASIDAIVTDPPYELGFMGREWDRSGVANDVSVWAECLRVLKPGGHLLAFSGSRTYHRMACAIEDAGFELRDQIMWIYGSGFPKSLNVAKAVDSQITMGGSSQSQMRKRDMGDTYRPHKNAGTDGFGDGNLRKGADGDRNLCDAVDLQTDAARQWQGWGTALKPAHEPICVARKPLVGTVAANVLEHGVGALNIDACRVHGADALGGQYTVKRFAPGASVNADGNWKQNVDYTGEMKAGRWPANVIHDGSNEVLAAFPDAPGQIARAKNDGTSSANQVYGALRNVTESPEPRVELDKSAARFFYCAKASRADRGEGNTHPTVKPTDLMAYLCRLVTPPGGTVLDPFMGSGSTGKACVREGFLFVGIDLTPEYVEIARARIAHEFDRINSERETAGRQGRLFELA